MNRLAPRDGQRPPVCVLCHNGSRAAHIDGDLQATVSTLSISLHCVVPRNAIVAFPSWLGGVFTQLSCIKTSPPLESGGYRKCSQPWRRPTFPAAYAASIIGAGDLRFRVRKGNGRYLAAHTTKVESIFTCFEGLAVLQPATGSSNRSYLQAGLKSRNYSLCLRQTPRSYERRTCQKE